MGKSPNQTPRNNEIRKWRSYVTDLFKIYYYVLNSLKKFWVYILYFKLFWKLFLFHDPFLSPCAICFRTTEILKVNNFEREWKSLDLRNVSGQRIRQWEEHFPRRSMGGRGHQNGHRNPPPPQRVSTPKDPLRNDINDKCQTLRNKRPNINTELYAVKSSSVKSI